VRNDGLKDPFSCICPHVELIDNVVPKGEARPSMVLPGKMVINNLRRSMHALRLESRGRIRPIFPAVKQVKIETAGLHPFYDHMMVILFVSLQRDHPFSRR
jgi:hypothetical protein